MKQIETRELDGDDDFAWIADLMAQRRERYAEYSPVFWRPRRGITDRHARFLARQAQDPATVALRTAHGFVIAQHRAPEGFVDDFAVDADSHWATAGAALLIAAWQRLADRGATTMRVVTARADRPKVEMLVGCGLALTEQWWVLPVTPDGGAAAESGRVDGPGFAAVLGPAPPVYDPGGPVLLAERVDPAAEPLQIAEQARRLGAVLAIAAAPPSTSLSQRLGAGGWTVASEWYVGQPARGSE